MEDLYEYGKKIQTELKLLEKAEISKRNKDLILDFMRYLEINNFSKARILKYLNKLRLIAGMIKKDFDMITRRDVELFMLNLKKREVNGKEISDETKKDYIILLKRFFKWFKGNDEVYPEEVNWIKNPFRKNGRIFPEDLLTEEEVRLMIKKCTNLRDKAIIALLYDSGMRVGELLSCKIKHVKFKDDYAEIINPTGKTGARRTLLLPSAPYLCNWIQNHPLGKDDDYLFISLSNKSQFRRLKQQAVNTMLKKVAKKCGITKRTNPHSFRHAAATKAAKFLTDAQLKQRFGWTQGSRMASVYVHMSGRDTDEAVMRMYGREIKKEDMKNKLEPKVCSFCQTPNGFDDKYCVKCSRPLSLEVAMQRKEKEKTEQEIIDMLKFAIENPELSFIEIMKKFRSFSQLKNCN